MTRTQTRLRATGLTIAAFGVFTTIALFTPLRPVLTLFYELATWPSGEAVPYGSVHFRMSVAILAGLTVGFGLFVWAMAGEIMAAAPEAAARVIRQATWGWFIVDSGGSILAGAPVNAGLNLLFLGPVLWALAAREPAPHSA